MLPLLKKPRKRPRIPLPPESNRRKSEKPFRRDPAERFFLYGVVISIRRQGNIFSMGAEEMFGYLAAGLVGNDPHHPF